MKLYILATILSSFLYSIVTTNIVFPSSRVVPQSSSPSNFRRRSPTRSNGAFTSNEIISTNDVLNKNLINNIISNGIMSLGFQINNELHIGQERTLYSDDKPIVFSPFNIAEALSLLMLGANGKTFSEIAKVLGLNNDIDINNYSQNIHEQFGQMINTFEPSTLKNNQALPQLTAVSALFVQEGYPIREEYKRFAQELYKSDLQQLNFARNAQMAKNVINNWVASKTNGKITDILADAPPPSTKVILATALYFKGEWENHFIEEATQKRPFYPYGRTNETKVLVDMMANVGEFKYYKDTELDCEMFALPYKGGTVDMYVVMPLLSNKRKLRELEQKLTPNNVDRMINQLNTREAIILMPKMKLESTLKLSSVLSDLGMETLFDPAEATLGLLSPGTNQINNQIPQFVPSQMNTPDEPYIFSRFKGQTNCSKFFEIDNNIMTNCTDYLPQPINNYTRVIYKRFGNKIGRRFARHYRIKRNPQINNRLQQSSTVKTNSIDELRNSINNNKNFVNPGLYADEILHKVYIDITEKGTEAAASTGVVINRSGHLTVRLDQPFLFFIRHKETKVNLFWGSINVPTPYYKA